MSNIQVHCEFCDKSLYKRVNGIQGSAIPDGVVSLTLGAERNTFEDNWAQFCDWECVAEWAFKNKRSGI